MKKILFDIHVWIRIYFPGYHILYYARNGYTSPLISNIVDNIILYVLIWVGI